MGNLREASADLPELRARLLSELPSLRVQLPDNVEISFYCSSSFVILVVFAVGFVAVLFCCFLYVRRLV